MRLWLAAVLLGSFAAGCRAEGDAAAPTSRSARGEDPNWTYVVRVAEDLSRFDVHMCFSGPAPESIEPGEEGAFARLISAQDEKGNELRADEGRVWLDGLGRNACVDYALAFDRPARSSRHWGLSRQSEDALIVSPLVWLWRPHLIPYDADLQVDFEMAEGMSVSVPWRPDPQDPNRYRFDRTAYKWLNHSAFGRLEQHEYEIAGAKFNVVVGEGQREATEEGIRRWIEDAGESVATVYGEFPADRVQVLVIPAGKSRAVRFGMAGRGGGAGVYLFLGGQAPDKNLVGDWTTVHEFFHLGMPFCEDRWMGEGFVSYQTQIARTRMGHWDEAAGWAELEEDFEEGRRAMIKGRGGTLLDPRRIGTVYNAGAAIAFLADVRLRRETKGRLDFDGAMKELHRCCGDRRDKVETADVFEHLDTWSGTKVFAGLEKMLGDTAFPPVEEAYDWLGIRVDGESIVLDDAAPGAKARASIMAPRK